MVCFSCFLRYHCACQIFADEVRFYSSRIEIFLAKRMNSPRLSSMYFSGKVPFLPSLSLKFFVGEGRSPGQARSLFRSFRKGSSEKFCPTNQPWSYSFARARVLQALADSAHMSFADFSDRYGLHSLRSGGATLVAKEGVPDHKFWVSPFFLTYGITEIRRIYYHTQRVFSTWKSHVRFGPTLDIRSIIHMDYLAGLCSWSGY